MTLLAVDPGIRGCGVALFADFVLVGAAYVPNTYRRGNRALEAAGMAHAVVGYVGNNQFFDAIALEWPQVYADRLRRGEMGGKDPNDLLALCGVDAAIVSRLMANTVASYLPAEWKGQLSKEACHARIAKRLAPLERAKLDEASALAGALAHNVWDAVGVGLHHLGRLKPRRVITGGENG